MSMHTQGREFEVQVRSNSSTAEEWKRAMEAPLSELPPLDEEQKEMAKRFGIAEEEYARGELARIYGQQGLKERGARLGSIVQRIVSSRDTSYRVTAVLYEGLKSRWIVQVEAPSGMRSVSIPRELADDVIDYELSESLQQLKQRLTEAVTEQ